MILCFLSADCSLLKGAGSASTSSAAVTAAKAVVAAKKKQNHDDPAVVIVAASTAIAVAVVATAAHQDDDPEDTVAGAASKKAGSIAASAVVAASATIVASTATVIVTSTVCSSQITHYKILQLFVYNSFYVDRLSGVQKYPVAKEMAMGYNTRVNTSNITNYKSEDFAELLGVSAKTLQRWGREGILKSKPNSNRQTLLHI